MTKNGRYTIRGNIGEGGSSYVYLAYDNVEKKYVAVKVLKEEFCNQESYQKNIEHEFQAMVNVDSPYVAKAYEYFTEQNETANRKDVCLVMEYVAGKSVNDVLEHKERIEWRAAVQYAKKVALALSAIHAAGIVHKDIKPHNIVITNHNEVKIVDFGISNYTKPGATKNNDRGGNAAGTISYTSPEQVKSHTLDYRTDIYSLGISLYEMVTGELPFKGNSDVEIGLAHVQNTPIPPKELNPYIPIGLNNIILKAMAKIRDNRFQSAMDMYRALDALEKDPKGFRLKLPQDAVAGSGYVAPEHINHRRRWVLPVLIATLLVTAGLVWGVVQLFKRTMKVEVPLAIGIKEEEAVSRLEAEGLTASVTYEKSNTVGAGMVLRLVPAPGEEVTHGTEVQVIVSSGRLILMPQLLGESYSSAVTMLNNNGINSNNVQVEYKASPEKYGCILAQNPEADTELTADTMVLLVVSGGAAEGQTVVNNYVGMELEAASEAIEADGLTVGEISYEYSEYAAGEVCAQGLEVKSMVESGSAVSLTVSKGAKANYPKELEIALPEAETPYDVEIVIRKLKGDRYTEVKTFTCNTSEGVHREKLYGNGEETYRIYIDGELAFQTKIDFSVKDDNE